MTEFQNRFRSIATDFLRTAIVIDDAAYSGAERTSVVLRPPSARRSYRSDPVEPTDSGRTSHDLDAARLVDGFARHGILCSVHRMDDEMGEKELGDLVDRADIVVLDWQMRNDNGAFALDRLRHLTTDKNRLRIVAVYTGEERLEMVAEKIVGSELTSETSWEILSSGMLRNGSCYVALYCKEGANPQLGFADRVVGEKKLPDRLVMDFVTITAGLLPAVVLTALTSVRDNAHRLLNSFGKRLDPAFLCHRSCLPIPDDAEALVVRMISGEIEEILEEAVVARRPAGLKAIDSWLETRELDFQLRSDVRKLLANGSEGSVQLLSDKLVGKKKPRKAHQWLTGILATSTDAERINLEFAWLASHRAVTGPEPKRLHLGTIVRECSESGGHYVCIRPRCDSVRLKGDTPFLFLSLTKEAGDSQLVIRTKNGFAKRTISNTPVVRTFAPADGTEVVQTRADDQNGHHFADCDEMKFEWVGELRQEFAQRIVHRFGSHLGRVAAEDSEWLRRTARGS